MKDYTGIKANHLTAIKFAKRKNKKTYWLFKCDCGSVTEKRVDKVLYSNPTTLSCGKCGLIKRGSPPIAKENSQNGYKVSFNKLYGSYKRKAKSRGYSFDIDKKLFLSIIKKNCFYCGIEPSNVIKSPASELIYNGIDRVNNEKGYYKDNCVPCCAICNRAKRDLDYKQFEKWIKRLVDFNIT